MDRPSSANPGLPRARKAAIDNFLAGLSPWDVLYLRGQLREGSVKVRGLASLADLPPELVCQVAEHMYLDDVLNCRLVSRHWHRAWDHQAVSSSLCRRFFPGLLELHETQAQSSARDLFLQSTQRYLRRHLAKPRRKSFIPWDAGWNPGVFRGQQAPKCDEPPSSFMLWEHILKVVYGDGKIAWQPGNTRVIVDDLRTCKRQICNLVWSFMSGRLLTVYAVTKDLLIFESLEPGSRICHHNVAQVWHLGLQEWKKVSLPGHVFECYAEGERVAFVTLQGHVVLWSWEGKAVEVNVTSALEDAKTGPSRRPSVMWHPTRRNVIFVAWYHEASGPDAREHDNEVVYEVTVSKYQDAKLVKPFREGILKLARPKYDPGSPVRFVPFCQKMNSHGLYWMGAVHMQSDRSWEPGTGHGLAAVGFNVLTETFLARRYVCNAPGNTETWSPYDRGAVWDDELIVAARSPATERRRTTWLQADDRFARADSDDVLLERQREVDGYMDADEMCHHIFSDDDFLLFATKTGILVWAFCREPRLPGAERGPGAVSR